MGDEYHSPGLSATLSPSDRERIRRIDSRLEPLNRSSRREEAHSISVEESQSLLTSAATRFMGWDGVKGFSEMSFGNR